MPAKIQVQVISQNSPSGSGQTWDNYRIPHQTNENRKLLICFK